MILHLHNCYSISIISKYIFLKHVQKMNILRKKRQKASFYFNINHYFNIINASVKKLEESRIIFNFLKFQF